MTEAERQGKLGYIARATAEELRGWVWAREVDKRPPFEGEQAALLARAVQLKITLKGN